MDYLRWLLKDVDFDSPFTIVIPIFSVFFTMLAFKINIVFGICVASLVVTVIGIILYIKVGDAFRKSYAEYLKEKNKP